MHLVWNKFRYVECESISPCVCIRCYCIISREKGERCWEKERDREKKRTWRMYNWKCCIKKFAHFVKIRIIAFRFINMQPLHIACQAISKICSCGGRILLIWLLSRSLPLKCYQFDNRSGAPLQSPESTKLRPWRSLTVDVHYSWELTA